MKHNTLALLVAGVTFALLGGTVGCGEDATGGSATGVSSQALSTASVPALDDLVTSLDLTPEQRTQMEAALGQLGDELKDRDRSRQQRRDGTGPGPGGDRQRLRDGAGMGGPRPVMEFLESCASFLDQGQFVSLVNQMAETRTERMENRGKGQGGPGMGPANGGPPHMGRGGGWGDGMGRGDGLNALDLTAEQRTQLQAARKAHRETMQALHEQFRSGAITEEQFRQQAQANREAMQAQLAGILTPEQLEQLQARRAEHRQERAERQLDRLDLRQEHMTEFLTKVLLLNETQQQQLATFANTVRTRTTALLKGVIDGSIEPPDTMSERRQIQDDFVSSFTAILDADQLQRWEALQSLLPQGPRRGH